MKHLITILFLIASFTARCQKCDTINGRVINCIDSIGRKQGPWMHVEKVYYADECKAPDCLYHGSPDDFHYKTTSAGEYKNDIKEGLWYRYIETTYPNFDREIWYKNGIILKEYDSDLWRIKLENGNMSEGNSSDGFEKGESIYHGIYSIEYNSDTSFVVGTAKRRNVTVQINCVNKQCTLKTVDGIEFLSFTSDKLKSSLLRLSEGELDLTIGLKRRYPGRYQ